MPEGDTDFINNLSLKKKMDEYYKFKRGKLRELVAKAINITGSERKLKLKTGISLGSINKYKREKINLSHNNLSKLLDLLSLKKEEVSCDIKNILPSNWGQKIGAKNAYKLKLKNGTFKENLEKMNKASSIYKKKWHKYMKENNLERYHKLQYEYFKKIGGYKYKTKNGEKVRNLLEKETADYLISRNLSYEYEPMIKLDDKVYFPDFKVGNLIIEVTDWKGLMKIEKLKEKQINFEKNGLKVLLVVSQRVAKSYEGKGFNLVVGQNSLSNFL